MKLLFLPTLFAAALLQTGTANAQTATYVSHDKVVDCAKAGSLFKVPEYEVICYNKGNAVPDGAEVHATHGHVFYIVDGEAILVTGGTLMPPKPNATGQDGLPSIQGGVENHIAKGDVIVIPAGTPHWYKQVMKPVAYYSVNVETAGPDQSPVGTHVSHDKILGCAKGSSLFKTPAYEVICYNRATPGGGEGHARHAHVWYIVEGEATLVTGGTIVDAKSDTEGEPRGPRVDGGVTHHLVKGDVIVIPAGTPHWYKEVMKPVSYYSVNVVNVGKP